LSDLFELVFFVKSMFLS